MLGSLVDARGTIGKQNIGADPLGTLPIFNSLSSSILIGLPLFAHSASIVNEYSLLCNLPYTKGVANASAAQAAKKLSPVEAVILNPVFSSEKGYAQFIPLPSPR